MRVHVSRIVMSELEQGPTWEKWFGERMNGKSSWSFISNIPKYLKYRLKILGGKAYHKINIFF